jgi:AcrR family transcriptional regulator
MPKVSPEYRDRQRQRVLDAAAECFASKGFRDASMADIVAQSGLSPGAIYGYFSGKHEIVAAIADQRHNYESSLVASALSDQDLIGGLHQLVDAYFAWLADPLERQRRRLTVQVWSEALIDERLAATLSHGSPERALLVAALDAQGGLPEYLDSESIARLMLAVLQGFVLQQAWDPGIDVASYVTVAHELIDRLLGSPRPSVKR